MSDEDRDIGTDIIKAMQEALEWSRGNTKAKVTQYKCGQCGADVELSEDAGRDEMPLLCLKCQKLDRFKEMVVSGGDAVILALVPNTKGLSAISQAILIEAYYQKCTCNLTRELLVLAVRTALRYTEGRVCDCKGNFT